MYLVKLIFVKRSVSHLHDIVTDEYKCLKNLTHRAGPEPVAAAARVPPSGWTLQAWHGEEDERTQQRLDWPVSYAGLTLLPPLRSDEIKEEDNERSRSLSGLREPLITR